MEIEEEEEQSYGSFYAEDKISKNTMIQNTKLKNEIIEQDNNDKNDKNISNDQQFNHSIIELHEKIKNTVSSQPTPRNENSVEEVTHPKDEVPEIETQLKRNNNLSSLRKKVVFLPTNSLQSATKSIKTDTDIKEEIPNDSEEEKEGKKNENEIMEKKQSNYLPASVISSFKLEKLKLQKEKLNKSFKINSTNNSKSSEKKTPSISITIPTPSNPSKTNKKNLILPRISSASNLTNKKTFLLKPTNNNLTVIPHTNIATISNVNKKINYNPNQNKPPLYMVDKELKNLEKENISLIKELKNLNAILSDLVVKKIPLTVPREKKKPPPHLPKHPRVHSEEMNNEMEKNSNKKYLNSLINEYNALYKIYSAANNPEKKDELEKKLEEIEKEYHTNKVANNELRKQIIKNENYLYNFEQEQTSFIKNIEFLNAKYDLYKIKIIKKEKEIERMSKLVENENEKISDLQEKFKKLTEILKNYEETPSSLNQKLNEDNLTKQQEEKLQNLIKKKNIISHSRISAKKNYEQEIEKQKKYIEQLKSTISEVDTVLSNL